MLSFVINKLLWIIQIKLNFSFFLFLFTFKTLTKGIQLVKGGLGIFVCDADDDDESEIVWNKYWSGIYFISRLVSKTQKLCFNHSVTPGVAKQFHCNCWQMVAIKKIIFFFFTQKNFKKFFFFFCWKIFQLKYFTRIQRVHKLN